MCSDQFVHHFEICLKGGNGKGGGGVEEGSDLPRVVELKDNKG